MKSVSPSAGRSLYCEGRASWSRSAMIPSNLWRFLLPLNEQRGKERNGRIIWIHSHDYQVKFLSTLRHLDEFPSEMVRVRPAEAAWALHDTDSSSPSTQVCLAIFWTLIWISSFLLSSPVLNDWGVKVQKTLSQSQVTHDFTISYKAMT